MKLNLRLIDLSYAKFENPKKIMELGTIYCDTCIYKPWGKSPPLQGTSKRS